MSCGSATGMSRCASRSTRPRATTSSRFEQLIALVSTSDGGRQRAARHVQCQLARMASIGSLILEATCAVADCPICRAVARRFVPADEAIAEGRLFVPLGEQNVWATRVRVAAIFGDASAPVPFRSATSRRLDDASRMGPLSVAPLTDGLPVGGRAMLDMSTEWRLRVRGAVGAALFVDAGTSGLASRVSPLASFGWTWARAAVAVAPRHRPR